MNILKPGRYNANIWLSANQAVKLIHRYGYNLSKKTFYEYVCRKWNVRTRPHPGDPRHTLYFRGDIMGEINRGIETRAAIMQEARKISDAADPNEWISFPQLRRLAEEYGIHSKHVLESWLYNKGLRNAPTVRTLFEKNKYKGILMIRFGAQRYNREDAESLCIFMRDKKEAREASRKLPEVDYLPGDTWVPLTTFAPCGTTIFNKLANLCRYGKIQACLYNGKRHIDAMEAREALNWRTLLEIRKFWTPEKINSRLDWMQENDIASPWASEHRNSLKIYAPELAHL